jgi:hypothetical protein
MADTKSSPPEKVSRVAVQLPPFWAERPAVWFAQVFLGWHQLRKDQALPSDLAAGLPVCRRTKGHHNLSYRMRPLHHAEDRADEAAVPLERSSQSLDPYARDGWSQAVPVSEAPQKPRPRHASKFLHTIWSSRLHPQHSGYSRWPIRGQLGRCNLCADSTSEVATQPALASVGPPPTIPHFCRGHIRPGGSTQRWAGSSLHQLHGPSPQLKGPLLKL